MSHWATPLIGLPWHPEGEGPLAFSCWGLVRHVFRTQYGIDMPVVRVGEFTETENVRLIKQAAESSGWRQTSEVEPLDRDIVVMDGVKGRHVGVMIAMSAGLRLLHSEGYLTTRGPVGSVMAQRLRDVIASGYGDIELWRQA